MKVYVITKGYYSDYHICAVTLDEKHAEKLKKLHTDRYDEADIEEYDTEEYLNELEAFDDSRLPYGVNFDGRGGAASVYRCGYEGFKPKIIKYEKPFTRPSVIDMTVYLYAPDEQAAVKIAAEKRAKFLADKAGIS